MINKKIITGVIAMLMIFSSALMPVNTFAANNSKLSSKELDSVAYHGSDLGAMYTPESTAFKVWAPTASEVKVKLYTAGSDEENGAKTIAEQAMSYDKKNGTWSIIVSGNLKNIYYTYLVTVNGKTNETVDIYAKAVGINGNRGMVVDLNSTNPVDWDKDKSIATLNQTDAIIWEVHIKDFSNSATSGVTEKNRGKYLAFTETETTLENNGDIPTCVNYLSHLGINYVQINPFYDYASVNEAGDNNQFNWGYDPKNYNAPEGSYSSNPYDGNVRITEVKQMIQSLHNAGIGVIMDVVYNHTMFNEDSWFDLTVPGYYYRIDENGKWSNGSGCGNDTASEHAMYSKYMVDSVTYWAREYHIDGFRFDLMGLHDVNTMNAIRDSLDTLKNGKNLIMYGEAWNLTTNSTANLATQNNMNMLNDRIAAFNDGIRDSLRGNNFSLKEKGVLQGKGGAVKLKRGVLGAIDEWAKQPSQTVTYESCHDNLTLYDKLIGSVIDTNINYIARYDNLVEMNKLGSAVILTSQGMSFLLAGEEMARSKYGVENSYKSEPNINEIKWDNILKFPDLVSYYSGLIQIRKNFAPFCDPTKESAQNIKFIESTDDKVLAYTLLNTLTSDTQWKSVACVFNTSASEEKQVTISGENLPSTWVIIANNKESGLKSLGTVTNNTVTLPKSSAMILVDKASFEKCGLQEKESIKDKLKSIVIKKEEANTKSSNSIAEVQKETNKSSATSSLPLIIGGIAVAVAGAITGGVLYSKKHKGSK